MSFRFEKMVAMRYMLSRKKQGAISLIAGLAFLGIMLGVATLIVVMAVMSGFRYELMERILGINSHLTVSSSTQNYFHDYNDLLNTLSTSDGVKSATPAVYGKALAMANESTTGIEIRAYSPEGLQQKRLIAESLKITSMDDFQGNSVIIGREMARKMHIAIGDTIQVISSKIKKTLFTSLPRIRTFKVVGTFEVGMLEYDSSIIFMPITTAQHFFKVPDRISAIEIDIDDLQNVAPLSQKLHDELGINYDVTDWQEQNRAFIQSLDVERVVMFFILSLIILIASINIFSSMIILVNDKSRQTAILRTMGASRSSILTIFFMCGASVGVIGTIAGVTLGTGFAMNIEPIRHFIEELTGSNLFNPVVYFLTTLPVNMQSNDVINVIIMAVSISFIAPIIPAYNAAKRLPTEGIRYE